MCKSFQNNILYLVFEKKYFCAIRAFVWARRSEVRWGVAGQVEANERMHFERLKNPEKNKKNTKLAPQERK